MLQVLLAERFKLTAHKEARQTPSLILTVAKDNPNLRRSETSGEARKIIPHGSSVEFEQTTIAEFAEFISGPLGIPVLDQTNLEGRFDFKISTLENSGDRVDQQYDVMRTIQNQLGLKLERRNSPMETLVIDQIDRLPTEN